MLGWQSLISTLLLHHHLLSCSTVALQDNEAYTESSGRFIRAQGTEGGLIIQLPDLKVQDQLPLKSYSIVMDLYVDADNADDQYLASLFQVNDLNGGGELFLKKKDDNIIQVGAGGLYHGSIKLETWYRVAATLAPAEDNKNFMVMSKYLNGEPLADGKQEVASSQYELAQAMEAGDLDDAWMVLFQDGTSSNNNWSLRVAQVAVVARTLSDEEIEKLGSANPTELKLNVKDAPFFFVLNLVDGGDENGVIVKDDDNAVIVYDRTKLRPQAPHSFPTSAPSGLRPTVPQPDYGRLVPAQSPSGGLLMQMMDAVLSEQELPLSAYSMVMDVWIPSGFSQDYACLWQLNNDLDSDGDFFLKAEELDSGKIQIGMGISGTYHGDMDLEHWHRIVATYEPLDTVSMKLTKYVDGKSVGEQVLETERYGINTTFDQNGWLLWLADEDDETWDLRVGQMAFISRTLKEKEVQKLGGFEEKPFSLSKDEAILVSFQLTSADPVGNIVAKSSTDSSAVAVLVDRNTLSGGDEPRPAPSRAPLSRAPVGEGDYSPESGRLIPAQSPNGGYLLQMLELELSKQPTVPIREYTMIYDLYIDGNTNSYGCLWQLNDETFSDGDFFLKREEANGTTFYGIGISGDYQGQMMEFTWYRVVATYAPSTADASQMRLAKFIDGALVGEQSVEVDRFALRKDFSQRDAWMLLLADESDETMQFRVASISFVARTLSDKEVGALGRAKPNTISAEAVGVEDGSDVVYTSFELTDSLEVGADGILVSSSKDSTASAVLVDRTTLEPVKPPKEDKNAPTTDVGVFVPAQTSEGGLLLSIPAFGLSEDTPYLAYTLVMDLWIASNANDYGGLLQLNNYIDSDGELFFLKNDEGERTVYGIGINDEYSGEINPYEWHRIAVTLGASEKGGDYLELKKFVDGVKVGNQTVEYGRFGLNTEFDGKGWMILLHDNDEETTDLRLSFVSLVTRTMSEAEIKELGGPSAGSITSKVASTTDVYVSFDLSSNTSLSSGLLKSTDDSSTPAMLIDRTQQPISINPVLHRLMVKGTSATVDLSEVFESKRGSSLSYRIHSYLGDAVRASIEGSVVTLSAGDVLDWTDITVAADDRLGNTVKDLFRVRVVSSENAFSFVVLVCHR